MSFVARVYAPEVCAAGARVELGADEAHHLGRVIRARVGDVVRLFDGRGHEWQGTIASTDRRAVSVQVDGPVPATPEPHVAVTLAIAILKGDQMDSVMRDATALGATTIVPLATDNVTVPARAWRDDGPRDRWHRVALAAARQSGRAIVPSISAVTALPALLANRGDDECLVVCVEPAARDADWTNLSVPPSPQRATVLIGPEGGWSAGELDMLRQQGARPLSLGPRTLRAEAMPVVALTTLWSWWGW